MGLLKSFFITLVIISLTIIFGNTGSDLIRNIFLFIVGTAIGTVLSMIAYQIGRLYAAATDNDTFKYLFVLMGAWSGLGVALIIANIVLPTNPKVAQEVSFMSKCFKEIGSKSSCTCLYKKIEDKYPNINLETSYIDDNLTDAFQEYLLKSANECNRE